MKVLVVSIVNSAIKTRTCALMRTASSNDSVERKAADTMPYT
jgi:hypothetical protein